MRVLLIRPKPHKETIGLQNVMICEPLELEYVSSYIRKLGHKSMIVDMILEKKPLEFFLKKFRPDAVGISGYISHINIMKGLAKQVKAFNPEIVTIIGGVHAEVCPEDFRSRYVDYIIRANPLKTFGDILLSLESKKPLSDPLCVYGKGREKPVKEMTFDYPYPDRDRVKRYRSKYYYMFHRNCTLVKTSFGCPYNCKFCFCRQVTDDKYFARSLDNIVDELEGIRETEIYIVDDDFLFGRERLLKFCDMLKERGIEKKYLVYGRADFIAANEDVIKRFKEVGLRAVIVGLESCDSRELNDYNKRSDVEISEKAVSILKKYDVECYGTFILGLDWKWKDFSALLKWIKKLGLVFVNLQPLTPLRGTEMYEAYRKDFIVRENEYEKWDLAHLVVRPKYISVRRFYLYTLLLYYFVTANPKSGLYMIKKYGLHDTLKLSFGALLVNNQYVKKVIKGEQQ